jgi:hypothetical protein
MLVIVYENKDQEAAFINSPPYKGGEFIKTLALASGNLYQEREH